MSWQSAFGAVCHWCTVGVGLWCARLSQFSFPISEGGSHYVSETTPGFDLPLFNLTRHSSCINRNNFSSVCTMTMT